jgi:hypothetical protein
MISEVKLRMIDKIITPAILTGWGYFFSSNAFQAINGGTDLSFIEQMLSLGVGGIIAGLVLWWKRQDDQEHKEDIKKLNSEFKDTIKELNREHKDTINAIVSAGALREERMISALEITSKSIGDMSIVIDRISASVEISENLKEIMNKIDKLPKT